jgi:hypothetical protein
MKRRKTDSWRDKVDATGLNNVEGYRQIREVLASLTDSAETQRALDYIAIQFPAVRRMETVDVKDKFLELIAAAGLAKDQSFTPGEKELPYNLARGIRRSQAVALMLEKHPQTRLLAGFAVSLLSMFFGNVFDDVRKRQFGDSTLNFEQAMWAAGETLEFWGKSLKRGGPVDLPKGRVNVELIEMINVIRKHETQKLTFRELFDALQYAGIHVPDEESLRVFVFRAERRGHLKRRSSKSRAGAKRSEMPRQ